MPVGIETDHGLWVAALRETGRVIYPINPLAASRYRARSAVSGAKSDARKAAAQKAEPKVDPDKLTIEHKRLVRRAMLDAFRAIGIDQMKEAAYPKQKPVNDSTLAKQLVRQVRLPRPSTRNGSKGV